MREDKNKGFQFKEALDIILKWKLTLTSSINYRLDYNALLKPCGLSAIVRAFTLPTKSLRKFTFENRNWRDHEPLRFWVVEKINYWATVSTRKNFSEKRNFRETNFSRNESSTNESFEELNLGQLKYIRTHPGSSNESMNYIIEFFYLP